MDTIDLVAPAYRDAAKSFPNFSYDPAGLGQIRENLLLAYCKRYGDPFSFEKEEVRFPGRTGGPPVRALLYRPNSASSGPVPALLHMHGGGWVAGNADMMAGFCSALAQAHGILVLSVDYRLAPETTEPGLMDDCYAALAWLHDQADGLDVDRKRIAVMGDSAGGGLAAGLAIRSRDEGKYPLKAQFLIYPSLDERTGTVDAPSDNPTTGQFVVSREYYRQVIAARLGNGDLDDKEKSYVSPAMVENLKGLAPAFIGVGSLDLFLDECLHYAIRLSHAAVGIDLKVYGGVFHGFDLITENITEQFSRDLSDAINRLL